MQITIGSSEKAKAIINNYNKSIWIGILTKDSNAYVSIHHTPESLSVFMKELNESYEVYTRSLVTEQQNTVPESTADSTGTSEEIIISEFNGIAAIEC